MSTSEQQRQVYQLRKNTVGQKCKNMLKGCRDRARRDNIFFDLTVKELEEMWPEDNVCPILGIPLSLDNPTLADSSPSCDRLHSKIGYTKDNCNIISMRANRIKNNATIAELKAIIDWMGEQ